MQVFIMHVGSPGNIDIPYTVTQRRNLKEIIENIPKDAPERTYFATDQVLRNVFPTREFNCWGVPVRAEPSFNKTQAGDLVLILPTIGEGDGGIHQLGIIKAKCPVRCYEASRILWPNTPNDRLYPFLFFFNTEIGFRSWRDFLADVDINKNWDPRGWYRRIAPIRFKKWGDASNYLKFLREECGFRLLKTN
jgi:hypothetical protein